LLVLACAVALNVMLLIVIPKGFFPTQDSGRLIGAMQADQSISFQAMSQKLTTMMDIVRRDPAVRSVVGSTGAGGGGGASATNSASVYVSLKDQSERDPLDTILTRLRRAPVPGPCTGHPRGRAAVQRRLSIHAAGRQYRRGL
jgi:multidrug efflux pump